jgi:DNA-binding NarL/FixJ family response regulator
MMNIEKPNSNHTPIRVLMLDQHSMFREGLRRILATRPEFVIVGESGCAAEALTLTEGLKPDVILLELNLDGELNTDIIPNLLSAAGSARIILLTGIAEQHIWQLAVQLGVMGIVPKTNPADVLCKALVKVHSGEVWIDRTMMANVLNQLTRARSEDAQAESESSRISLLSDRERQVVALVGAGCRNREIARRLSISEITVRHHLSSIYSKLGVSDRLELTIYAYRYGLASLPT